MRRKRNKILITYGFSYVLVIVGLVYFSTFAGNKNNNSEIETKINETQKVSLNLKSYEADSMINLYCNKRTPWKKTKTNNDKTNKN
ncbi:MAG: hypothetical protein MJ209_00235 [archaeon]|nr:hypothetical protein [archaeon]